MSALSSLLDKVQRAYARIAELEAVAAQFPGDITVLGNISSLRRDAAKLELLWEEEALKAQQEVCRYRIVPQFVEAYGIRNVGQSLIGFQDLFSQIYDAIVEGKKARKRLSDEIVDTTALNFGFAYPGSLGVAMTVPSDRDLFNNRYDEIIADVLEVMKLHNEREVREIADRYGVAVVKRLYDWSKVNSNAGYGIGLAWKTSTGQSSARTVDSSDFARNVDLISRVSEATRRTLTTFGTLLGIDRAVRSFRFVTEDDKVFSGRLSDAFPVHVQWSINTPYGAELEEETTTRFATDETTVSYRLLNLQSL